MHIQKHNSSIVVQVMEIKVERLTCKARERDQNFCFLSGQSKLVVWLEGFGFATRKIGLLVQDNACVPTL